ncbi:MAG TPA: hypothetical protein PLJ47_12515 [Candidatus Hydrogenedentes bacterium]|nr:hypothetical protein [Candidatus Hydrogenedentota bacterium]
MLQNLLALAVIVAPDALLGESTPRGSVAEGQISVEAIVAEQIRYADLIGQYSFVAHKKAYEIEDDGEKFESNETYYVVRSGFSTMVTVESRNSIQVHTQTNQQTYGDGAMKYLITPELTARWVDLAQPRLYMQYAEDWKLGSKENSAYGIESIRGSLAAIDPRSVSFGMVGGASLWESLPGEQALSDKARGHWVCAFTDPEKTLVRAERFKPGQTRPNLIYTLDLANGAQVLNGEFWPDVNARFPLRTVKKTYTTVDGLRLLERQEVESFSETGTIMSRTETAYSGYVRNEANREFGLEDLGIPDGARVIRKKRDGGQVANVWRQGKLVEVPVEYFFVPN